MTRQALLSIPNNPLIIKTNQVSKWEYFTASVGFNLPADVALYKEFSCDADGKPDCEFDDCELSATARYSINSLMGHFLNWFVAAMSKNLQTATHISCRSLAACTRKCCPLDTLAYRLLLSQFDYYLFSSRIF